MPLLLAVVLAAAALSLPAGQGAADPRADGARAAKVAAALTGPFNISRSSTPSSEPLVGVDG
jgi:hypothetical protein